MIKEELAPLTLAEKSFLRTIVRLKNNEVITDISENNILAHLKILNKYKCLQKIIGWHHIAPKKERPKPEDIHNPKKYKRNLTRKKAFEYCKTINKRLNQLDGVFVGNDTDFKYLLVHKVWVFGSTAKGSKNPNDLDILYDYNVLNIAREYSDEILYQFLVFLTEGMRQVCLHDYIVDNAIAGDHKIEIYPKFKLKF
jgi:predicted nucleotidyltransferase